MMKKTASILILVLVLTSFCYFHIKEVHAVTEVIVNGDFETGDLTGWTWGGNDVFTDDFIEAHSPTHYCVLTVNAGGEPNSWIQQTLNTPIKTDDIQRLALWGHAGAEYHGQIKLTVLYLDASNQTFELQTDDFWKELNVTSQLIASKTITAIRIESFLDDPDVDVDDVSILVDDSISYFNFDFLDLDSEDVELYVDWELWNSTHDINYAEGETSLDSGTYYLKTSKYEHLINTTTLDTETYGNSTIDIHLNMKRHQSCPNGFIASNDTISSIIVHAETPQLLNFTMSGNVPVQLGVGVPKNASYVQKDGVNMTDWVYVRSPSHIYFDVTSLSNFVFVFPSTTGPVVGPHTDTNLRVKVIVTLNGEWLKECNVTMEGGPENISLWGLTDLFGIYIFWVKNGSYEIVASYEEYRKVKPVNITRNIIIYIDFTIEDIITEDDLLDVLTDDLIDMARDFEAWLNLPELDLTCEAILILFLLLLLLIIYAVKKVSEGPKRKWKYSYLK